MSTVVVGAGIEGLVCALRLARAGRRVTVLETRDLPGGSAAREELGHGAATQGLLHDASCARRDLLDALDLGRHGLVWREPPARVVLGERGAVLASLARADGGLRGAADTEQRDRAALAGLADFVDAVRGPLVQLVDQRPPDVASRRAGDLVELARTAFRMRRLGEKHLLELARVAPRPVRDWLGETFASQAVQAALAAPALIGTTVGPRAAGTSALLLLRETTRGAEPVGGPAALAAALVAAARAKGVEIATASRVRRVRLEQGRVRGVELANGEPVDAEHVVSTLDPRTTLLELLAPMSLPLEHERAAGVWRSRGTTASLALVLEGPSPFAQAEAAHVTTAEDLDRLERGADALKYARLPERPWLDARDLGPLPDAHSSTGSGTGSGASSLRVVSLLVHCVPYALRAGWDGAARAELERRTLAELERVAPGSAARVRASRLLTPPDIEQRFGHAGGHVFHGELALDQLWFQRPSIALPRYATPLDGLFLGGPGTHPGGPFLGGSGTLAAEAVLAR